MPPNECKPCTRQARFSAAVQARLLQTQLYMGRLAAVHAALTEISEEERDTGDMRLATAVVHLAEGEADQAADVLAPVIQFRSGQETSGDTDRRV